MQKESLLYIATISVLLLSAGTAGAACTDPAGNIGQVVYNGDTNAPQFCNGGDWIALGAVNPSAGGDGCTDPVGTEGRIIYNGDLHIPQYCDGDDWRAMIGFLDSEPIGCEAPVLCPNIGNVCDDSNPGTVNDPIFAGFMIYNDENSADFGFCKPLYVTNNNQSGSVQWSTTQTTNQVAPSSTDDGKVNHENLVAGTFPAFSLCEGLSDGGYSDWYVPARSELHLLWMNKSAINAGSAANFAAGIYWSSSEYTTAPAWGQYFVAGTDGDHATVTKTLARNLRCVRRD